MKRYHLSFLLLFLMLSACGRSNVTVIGGADGPTSVFVSQQSNETATPAPLAPSAEENAGLTDEPVYRSISPEEAKSIMDSGEEYFLLDVREQYEYDESHIPGAQLMPYTQTKELAEQLVPDRSATVLVYCRSGRRSKIASETLASMGYSHVLEFGGIIDWPYELE